MDTDNKMQSMTLDQIKNRNVNKPEGILGKMKSRLLRGDLVDVDDFGKQS